ncbi:hypothetical protein QA601_18860, partial [Chitinispirillales bacterium ANBcel5]|nr:hypothetical protein [Chitinispirillales bacterium ANBcel5]
CADVGRWISTDPKEQFWDRYAYVGNGYNPINAVDPDGNEVNFIFITLDGQLATDYDIAAVLDPLFTSEDFLEIYRPMENATDRVFNVIIITDINETSPGELGFVNRNDIFSVKNRAGGNAAAYPMGVSGAREPSTVGGTIFHEMFHRYMQVFKGCTDWDAHHDIMENKQQRVEDVYSQ